MEDEVLAIYDETRKPKGSAKDSLKATDIKPSPDATTVDTTQETLGMLVDHEKETEVIEMNELPPVQLQLPVTKKRKPKPRNKHD